MIELGLSPERRLALLIALAVACYLACFLAMRGRASDDAGILLSYARSLSEGRGLVLTPEAERSEGCTNLLGVLFLSLAWGRGADPVALAEAASLLFGIVAIVLAGLLPSRLSERAASPIDALAAWCLALSAPLVYRTAAGLEMTLFLALVLLAAWSHTVEAESATPVPLSALLLFLASLVRPEGPLYAAAAAAGVLAAHFRRPAYVLEWLATFAVPYGLLLAWRYAYFGVVLPPLFDAKLGAAWSEGMSLGGAGARALGSYFDAAWPWYLALPAAVGLARIIFAGSGVWAAGSLCAATAFALGANAGTLERAEWLAPMLPFLFIGLAEGMRLFVNFLYSPDPVKVSKDAPTLAAALSLAIVLLRLSWSAPDAGQRPAHLTLARGVAIGESLAGLAHQAGVDHPTLAASEIGGVSWAGSADVIDLSGDADRTFSRYGRSPAVFRECLFDEKMPTFLRFSRQWGEPSGLEVAPRLEADYAPMPPLALDGPADETWVRRDVLHPAAGEKPEIVAECSYGGELTLIGVARATAAVKPGGRAELVLFWRAGTPTLGTHTVKVDLSGPASIHDQRPLALGWLPADRWQPGETICERFGIDVPRTAREGDYRIAVGVDSPLGRELDAGVSLPPDATLRVSACEARKRARALTSALGALAAGDCPREALAGALRELELSGASTAEELRLARRRAGEELTRRVMNAVGGGRYDAGVVDWLLTARRWGAPVSELVQRVSSELALRARQEAARGELTGAARKLSMTLALDCTNVAAARARDEIWEKLAAAAPVVVASAQ